MKSDETTPSSSLSVKEPEKNKLFSSLKSIPSVPTNLQEIQQKLRSQSSAPAQSSHAPSESQPVTVSRKQFFDKKSVEDAFQEMAAQLRKEDGSPFELVILENCPIEVLDNHTIKITLSNAIQEGHLLNLKTKLLPFLKEKLQNDVVQVIHEVKQNAEHEKKRLYTNQEKYRFLVEKYPILDELKNKLGFEIDW